MTRTVLAQLGELGIVKDTMFYELPPRAWTAGRNVRFIDGAVMPMGGTSDIDTSTMFAVPKHCLYVSNTAFNGVVYLTNNNAAAVSALNTEADITRIVDGTTYNATDADRWTSGTLGGIPFFNNRTDLPQVWTPASLGQRLTNLANFPSTLRFRAMRPFKNFLIGLYAYKSGTEFPHMVKWSHSADPGAVPSSWDEADPTKLAGEVDLADSLGACVDCLPLYDANIVYKQDAVWQMSFVGAPQVFSFRKIFTDFGAFTARSIVEFNGKHAVFTADDLIVHNGNTWNSILTKAWRRFLLARIGVNANQLFLYYNRPRKEVWLCYPTGSSVYANEALIWNTKDNTFGVYDLEQITHICEGAVATNTDTWDLDPQIWDIDNSLWNLGGVTTRAVHPTGTQGTTPGKLLALDSGNKFSSASREVIVERQGLAIDGGVDDGGQPRCDLTTIKFIDSIRPKFRCDNNELLEFYVGLQMSIEETPTWLGPFTCNVANNFKIDITASARLLSLKARSTGDVNWELWGFEIDLTPVSRF